MILAVQPVIQWSQVAGGVKMGRERNGFILLKGVLAAGATNFCSLSLVATTWSCGLVHKKQNFGASFYAGTTGCSRPQVTRHKQGQHQQQGYFPQQFLHACKLPYALNAYC